MDLEITRATEADWPVIKAWCADEGWNPGDEDGPCFLSQDPEGFFLGRVDGLPVSSVSVVNYGDDFAFLGLYLVRPEYRGKGFGLATWRHAVPHAGTRPIGLDGVVAQQDNYRRSGFQASHRNVRYSGSIVPNADSGSNADSDADANSGANSGADVPALAEKGILPCARVPFEQIAAYDARCFPADRPAFLRKWLTAPGHIALARIVDGRLAGYGAIRLARENPKIGPLYADTPADARALMDALVAAIGPAAGGVVSIDVPENNPQATALAESYGLRPVFECARMYTGPIRDVAGTRVFGVSSLELG